MGRRKLYIRFSVLIIFLLLVFERHHIFNKNTRSSNIVSTNANCETTLPGCLNHSSAATNRSLSGQSQDRHSSRQCFKLIWNYTEFKSYIHHTTGFHSEVETTGVRCGRFIEMDMLKGSRLGNQMFQTAALIGTAFEHDLIPVLSSRLLVSKYFELPNKSKRFHLESKEICAPPLPGVYEACNKSEGNLLIHGYFQSWKYFQNIPDIVRKLFTFKVKYRILAESFIRYHSKRNYQNVCLHVRRGDMMWSYHKDRGLAVADVDFFYKAIKYFKNMYEHIVFFVVSDDIAWCKANINETVIYSRFLDPGVDLALLSLCDNVVVSSGTFGWWGAWLSGGTTVYFSGYPRPGSRQDSRVKRVDYYPPNWIGI